MDVVEESPSSHVINNDLSPVAKGKRTKRPRPQSPTNYINYPFTQEEEDIAECLVLLAQGYFVNSNNNIHDNSKRINYVNANDRCGPTSVYACKTCDRVFSSFQALGGHRTSHKKPKIEKRGASSFGYEFDDDFTLKKKLPPPPSPSPPIPHRSSLSLQLFSAGKRPRVHECSYCGAEFTSGQALGGHMRRHRVLPIPGRVGIKPDPLPNRMSLDLNFPAPDDHDNAKFEFGSRRLEKLVQVSTNTPTLVDCHF